MARERRVPIWQGGSDERLAGGRRGPDPLPTTRNQASPSELGKGSAAPSAGVRLAQE
jgi:hypothetical protein